eukprot:Sdes_comp17807_c0_seq1m7071
MNLQKLPISLVCFFSLYLFSQLSSTHAASDQSMTLQVQSGDVFCVYQPLQKSAPYVIEFQVIAGGALDIDVTVFAPSGLMVIYQLSQSEGVYSRSAEEDGDYKICLGNTMSTVTEKWVFLEINVDREHQFQDYDALVSQQGHEDRYNTMSSLTQNIRLNLHDISMNQIFLRYREARHRNTAESTNSRVVIWSFIECIVLVAISILQVHFVKRFFKSEKRRINF